MGIKKVSRCLRLVGRCIMAYRYGWMDGWMDGTPPGRYRSSTTSTPTFTPTHTPSVQINQSLSSQVEGGPAYAICALCAGADMRCVYAWS